MHFEITLKENESSNTNDSIVTFPINLKELVWATQETYSNLGTPYAPIRADNFISLTGNEFPSIPPDTHLEIKLISEDEAEKHYASNLVCCLAKNVGKKFNNEERTYYFVLDPVVHIRSRD